MLKILIDNLKEDNSAYESYVSDYFDSEYELEWFQNDYVKYIIQTIDDTIVQSGYLLYNETLGMIPPQYLSSGCKGLILLYLTDLKIDGDRLGDNCIPILMEIASQKEIGISLSHIPPFPDEFDAIIVNTGKLIKTKAEFLSQYIRLI